MVNAGDVVGTADQERRVVVAAVAIPGQGIGRSGFTEGKTGELDEHHFDSDLAVAGRVVVQRAQERSAVERLIGGGAAIGAELEVTLAEGTDNAVFGGGARIERQGHAGTNIDSVGETIALARLVATVTTPEWRTVDAAAIGGIDAQIATQLDAGVGARNVEETGSVNGADP